mmetsp:Transcript_6354/g.9236  ORF Transcript_6354/g.9236 Transcript_6354/m.9236 type:complete len:112 (+) Transcript_6354:284-619(+)
MEQFFNIVPENHTSHMQLKKIFLRKIRSNQGDDYDSDDDCDDEDEDELDFDDDEDEVEDNCPVSCDNDLYEQVLHLRETRRFHLKYIFYFLLFLRLGQTASRYCYSYSLLG